MNIDFGSIPPADTSKLWVPLAKKPDVVNITNNVSAIADTAQVVFGASRSSYAVNAFSLIDDKIIFSDRVSHAGANSVGYVSLSDFTHSIYSSAYRTIAPMTKIKDKIYTTVMSDDVGSWSFKRHCYSVNLVPGQIVSFQVASRDSYAVPNVSTPITVGDDMYYIGGTSGSWDADKWGGLIAKCPYGGNETTYVTTNSAFMMAFPSTLSYYNGKIYFICKPSLVATDYTYDLCVFDPSTNTTTRLKSDVITVGGLQRDTIPFFVIDGVGYAVDIKGTLFKIDISSYESTSIPNAFPFSEANDTVLLGVSYGGSLYIRQPKSVSSTDIGPIYKLTPHIDVAKNTLCIIYDGHNEKWNALTGKDTQLKIDPIQIYLGNDKGAGEKVAGYLYDGSKWVSVEDGSPYLDMLNALNIMGVN